ncbi:hypothetical protein N9996_01875 [Synechococcus sp. AH-603-M21]|nr:hypothetical protein [Synechococcus sp. AH-603-M21]
MNLSDFYGFRLLNKKNIVIEKSDLLLSEFANAKLDSRIGEGGKTPPPPTIPPRRDR